MKYDHYPGFVIGKFHRAVFSRPEKVSQPVISPLGKRPAQLIRLHYQTCHCQIVASFAAMLHNVFLAISGHG
jgi:hypothetical protein